MKQRLEPALGLVSKEIEIVRAGFRATRRSKNIRLATGYANILADLEVLHGQGVEFFRVDENGKVEGIRT